MGEGSLDHVGHRLEAPVRVPGGSLRLTGRVVDLTHLVHVHEGVQVTQAHPGERPAHRESLTLESSRRRGHRGHRAFGRQDRVENNDPGQR